MKNLVVIVVFGLVLYSCAGSKKMTTSTTQASTAENDTLRIANDSLDYEIIIIEPGFKGWLVTQPPRGFRSQTYLETHNQQDVTVYNSRVSDTRYSQGLYPQSINYEFDVDYGYEVNYLLFNYFLYFQKEYRQRL